MSYGGQQQQQPQWYNSPTMQALQNFQQTDYVQPQHQQQQQQWGEETQNAGPGIRHLVDSDHRKITPVLDYSVGIVSPEDQSVTAQNYRSRQLLYPEPKAKHYYPVGTYMTKPSYLLPNPEPKASHDTMFQTNVPAPPSCIRPGTARRGGPQYKPGSPSWANNAPSPQNQTGQYHQNGGTPSSAYSRPAWVGGSPNQMNRSMSGGSSPQPSVSRMVQWPPQSPTGSSSPQQQQQQQQYQPQQQQQGGGGGGYNVQTPSWQRPNLNTGPSAYDIEVANPDPSSRVVHMQFNSPMGLYSAQNVADSLQGQTGLNPTVRKAGDFRQSPTYQAVMNQGGGGGASNM